MRGTPQTLVPPIEKMIDLYERMAEPVYPTKVVAVAVNTAALPDAAARQKIERIESLTGLPTTDVIRFGTTELMKAILEFEQKWRSEKSERNVFKRRT